MTSRRRFLLYSGAAMLSTGVTVYTGSDKGGANPVATALSSSAEVPHLKDFESHTRETFHLQTAAGKRMNLRLSEVGDDPFDAQLEQFHLTFQGPRDELLEQGVYTLEHPKLGKLDLLLVPDRLARRGPQFYNVSFSRFIA